ncbi:MAG TPA: hypothetical protein VFA09_07005 [Ktedonobacteraceae bacterium]|nr:hypothetical protein [Ktedonobacteraceae bacterium]
MSDMSVLSHEYKTASDLSQRISNALIILKKVRYNLPWGETIDAEQLNDSVRTLAEILTTLVNLLSASRARHVKDITTVQIPGALIVRLRTERRGDLAYYLDDLSRVAAQLHSEPLQLSNEDLALLDHLAMLADAEASSVFRRLMRL